MGHCLRLGAPRDIEKGDIGHKYWGGSGHEAGIEQDKERTPLAVDL